MGKLVLVLTLMVLLDLCLAGPWDRHGRRGRGGGRGRSRGSRGGWSRGSMRDYGGRGWDRMPGPRFSGLHGHHGGHHGHRFRWGLGPTSDPWFTFDLGFNNGGPDEPWWSGPNVCFSESEATENVTSEMSTDTSFQSMVCDGSDQTFRCTKTRLTPKGKVTTTETYECCPGYTRQPTDHGCPRDTDLVDLATMLEELELTEFASLMNGTGLSKKILADPDSNFTVFAPTNDALKSFSAALQTVEKDLKLQGDPNVIMVSKDIQETVVEDTRNVLLGHVASGRLTSSQLQDGTLVETVSPFKSSVRINRYVMPDMVTANCRKLSRVNSVASNGVVHVVEGVLEPAGGTLLELVSKNPELSWLKTALGSSSLGARLREDDGHYTVFAPTDSAFKKHAKTLKKTMANSKCLDNVLKNHILDYVICSPAVRKESGVRNMVPRYVGLTRDVNGKVRVDDAKIVSPDVMATNGVLHIIDKVLMPDEALGILDLAEKQGLTEFGHLVAKAGLKKKLSNLDNVTVLVPSNDAIQALSPAEMQELTSDPDYFKSVLEYHVVAGTRAMELLYNDVELDTVSGAKIRVNKYSTFPYGRGQTWTAQCARFEPRSTITSCNGKMVVTEKLLLPPRGNVVDVLAQDARFNTLVELLKIADLADTLQENGPFTVFAPTNDAFDELGSDAVAEMKENRGVLKSTLLNHVTRDAVCCTAILRTNWLNTQKVRTMSQEVFEIGKSRRDVTYIGNADVTECDKMATNGVVHVVDRVVMKQQRKSDPFWEGFW